jgi:hypothetical protein
MGTIFGLRSSSRPIWDIFFSAISIFLLLFTAIYKSYLWEFGFMLRPFFMILRGDNVLINLGLARVFFLPAKPKSLLNTWLSSFIIKYLSAVELREISSPFFFPVLTNFS